MLLTSGLDADSSFQRVADNDGKHYGRDESIQPIALAQEVEEGKQHAQHGR